MSEHEEREPDHTDDPRGQDTGQGYPEEGQPGSSPGSKTPESGTGGADAPDTSSDEEGDAGQATGNPDAAG